jgi:NAD(P)H-flavin reductase
MPQHTIAYLQDRIYSPSGKTAYLTFQVETKRPFIEGQFVMITSHEDKPRKKPYSIASTNKELQEQGIMRFVIKETSPYGVSHYLNQTLQP